MASALQARDEARLDRQLGRRELERHLRRRLVDTVDLEQDLARLDPADPELRRTLARAHADLSRLLGYRHIGEDADPDATDALQFAGDRAACRFDLARGHPA